MYDPNDFNSSDKNTSPSQPSGNSSTPQGNVWQSPAQQNSYPKWDGSTYHSGPQQTVHQASWNSASPLPPQKQKKERKHHSGHPVLKVVAMCLVCLIISAGSIGGFTALVNNGYITLNSGTNGSSYTINKVVENTNTNTSTGSLSMQEIAKKTIPSVVCIQNYQINSNYGWVNQASTSSNDVSPSSEGSGIIMSEDGYIITNAHVVSGATSLKVITSDNQTYEAELVGSDEVTDLALLKINATGLTPAEFGSSDDLQVADTVMAVGNPGGMTFNSSVTIGYVSALNREVSIQTDTNNIYTMQCIQTDAAINPGNSGGALVNAYGYVVGINSSKFVATGYEGLGFAIPIDHAMPIIEDLKNYGYVKDRASLGINGQVVDSMTARFYGLPTGFFISSITNPSIAAQGIQENDVITAIDGNEITSSSAITSVVTAKKPGDTVTLNVTRPKTGQTFTVTVTIAESTG